MNDSEYIELLNLYLDHEISAADAARLEAEVQNNPARWRIYQQYCRMQKACKMVAADFQTEPEHSGSETETKVVAFDPESAATAGAQRRRVGGLYTVGTFAAVAACVAIIFIGRERQANNATPTFAATQPEVQTTPVSAIPNPDATFVASDSAEPRGLVVVTPRSQQTLVRVPLLLTGSGQTEPFFTPTTHQPNNQLEWINSVQLAPLQQRALADLHFAATLRSEGRALGNRASSPGKESQPGDEYIGFEFRK